MPRGPRSAVLVAALLGLSIAVATAPAAARPKRSLEPFDPHASYGYELATGDASVLTVDLGERGFDWPSGAAGDTAFLEIDIIKARRGAPAIRVKSGAVELHQVLEDGAGGRRFVDLSPLLQAGAAPDRPVTLEGDGVRFRLGPARLFTFENPPIDGLRILVVAPHPDDAEIAAFGLYSSADADVVTVTAGDAGEQGFAALYSEPGEHYRVKGWIRTWDSITVPFFGGIAPGRARNLGYYDATLGQLWRKRPDALAPALAVLDHPGWYRDLNLDAALRERPLVPTWPGLVADLRAELDRVRPRVVVAPHPLIDRHLDHQFTTLALIEALESWDGDCELWLYTNHAVGNESWPLGPRTAMTGLPPWAGGDLFFSRLYSHPLDPERRKRKLVALEAMHDLRPFDPRDGIASPAPAREREAARRYDYFRRAPRPNELFFVVTRAAAARLGAFFRSRQSRGEPAVAH